MTEPNKMLWEGVEEDDFDKVRIALNLKAEVNAKNEYGITPLHLAAWNNSRAVARLLISSGAEVNEKDKWGETPLHRAARYNHLAVTELLISSGAEVDVKDNRGLTPLDRAKSQEMKTLLQGVTI